MTGDVGANSVLSPNSRKDKDANDDGNADEQDKLVKIKVSEHAQMLSPSSRVVGDTIALRGNAKVFNVYYNELINKRGVILGTKTTPLALPVLTLPALPSIMPGTQDVELKQKATRTLAPGSYGKITVKEGGTLVLTGGVYHVDTLDIRGKTDILFRGPSQLRVKNEMDTDAGTYIGPDPSLSGLTASDIVIYVAGTDDKGRRHDDDDVSPTAVQIGEKNTVVANIYAPNGTIHLRASTKATGAFIGKRVIIGEKVELTLKSAF